MVNCRLKRNKNLSSCKKLKCWKKVGEREGFVKYNKKTSRSRVILQKFPFGWDINVNKKLIGTNIKTKKEAEKRAKNYMRKHDRC